VTGSDEILEPSARSAIGAIFVFDVQSNVPLVPAMAGKLKSAQCPRGFSAGTVSAFGTTLPEESRAVQVILAVAAASRLAMAKPV